MNPIIPARTSSCWLVMLALSLCGSVVASAGENDPEPESEAYLPESVGPDDFRHLSESSPFTRPLNLSASLVLTGIASIEGRPMAVLMDRETKEIHVLSDEPNPEGWKIVEITPSAKLEDVVATISIGGTAIANVRYEAGALSPEFKPIKYQYDNQGRAIPPQPLIDKFKKMNREQMGRYQAWRAEMVKKDPSLDKSPKRFPIIERAMDAILSGKEPGRP